MLQKFTVDSDMLVTFQEHQDWQQLVPHLSRVWSRVETTVAKHWGCRIRVIYYPSTRWVMRLGTRVADRKRK